MTTNHPESPIRITLRGVTFELTALGTRHHEEVKRRILAERVDALDLAIAKIQKHKLDEPQARFLLKSAWDESTRASSVMATELAEFMGSVDGLCFVFWLSVRDRQPSVTLESCKELLLGLSVSELDLARQSMDRASGHGEPGGDGQPGSNPGQHTEAAAAAA